jgi:signal transduction histidine kinase
VGRVSTPTGDDRLPPRAGGLTNVVKHAHASAARVSIGVSDGKITIEVQDDGVGFDPDAQTSGFGLAGMRERAYLAGGTLELEATEPGTLVRARLPVARSSEAGSASRPDQLAS